MGESACLLRTGRTAGPARRTWWPRCTTRRRPATPAPPPARCRNASARSGSPARSHGARCRPRTRDGVRHGVGGPGVVPGGEPPAQPDAGQWVPRRAATTPGRAPAHHPRRGRPPARPLPGARRPMFSTSTVGRIDPCRVLRPALGRRARHGESRAGARSMTVIVGASAPTRCGARAGAVAYRVTATPSDNARTGTAETTRVRGGRPRAPTRAGRAATGRAPCPCPGVPPTRG